MVFEDRKEDPTLTKTLHILYHEWEHYSSIRNIDGPHMGPANVCLKRLLDYEADINTSGTIDPRLRISRQKCCTCQSKDQNITMLKKPSADPSDGEVDPVENIAPKTCDPSFDHNLDNSMVTIEDGSELEDFSQISNNGEKESLKNKEADRSAHEIRSKHEIREASPNHEPAVSQHPSHRRKRELAKKRRKENRIRTFQSKSAQNALENSKISTNIDLTTARFRNILI